MKTQLHNKELISDIKLSTILTKQQHWPRKGSKSWNFWWQNNKLKFSSFSLSFSYFFLSFSFSFSLSLFSLSLLFLSYHVYSSPISLRQAPNSESYEFIIRPLVWSSQPERFSISCKWYQIQAFSQKENWASSYLKHFGNNLKPKMIHCKRQLTRFQYFAFCNFRKRQSPSCIRIENTRHLDSRKSHFFVSLSKLYYY